MILESFQHLKLNKNKNNQMEKVNRKNLWVRHGQKEPCSRGTYLETEPQKNINIGIKKFEEFLMVHIFTLFLSDKCYTVCHGL